MVKYHNPDILSDQDIAVEFRSSDLLLMMMRILALKKQTPGLHIWRYRPELDMSVTKWLYESFRLTAPDERSYFYLVSSCLTPACWNTIDYSIFSTILSKPKWYPNFTVQCLSSPYIAADEIGINDDIPASYIDSGKRMANRMFSLLYEAAMRRDQRFCLHRSERILPAHWVATGNRMAIAELGSLERMESTYSAYDNVICVEGPSSAISAFAKSEFDRQTANAADTAVLYREIMKNNKGSFQRLVDDNNQIPPNTSYKLAHLDPHFDDMAEVTHFMQKMRKIGNFLLTEPRAIVKACELADNIADSCLEQDYEQA